MSEADPVALSALQHWVYCPRQCGLIHLEQAFEENLHKDIMEVHQYRPTNWSGAD
jgi:hypothetical protein